jgi:hypothetical protein
MRHRYSRLKHPDVSQTDVAPVENLLATGLNFLLLNGETRIGPTINAFIGLLRVPAQRLSSAMPEQNRALAKKG